MRHGSTREGGKAKRHPGCPRKCLGSIATALVVALGFCVATAMAAPDTYTMHDELFAVSFADEREGWACGDWGVILHTRDGGKTWEAQASGTEATLSSIFFLDALLGWAVGNQGTILHTADGGQTWVAQEGPVSYFHGDIFFASARKGWIVSEMTTILATEDGGQTWRVQFEDDIYNLAAISFSDEEHGWAVGEYGFTYRTSDGGKNWEHQAGYFEVSEETGDIDTGVTLFDVVALDDATGLAVGADGVVTMTRDGGASWRRVEADIPEVLLFGAATDGAGAIAIGGKGAYLVSTDRGSSWVRAPMDPPMNYRWLYGFAALGKGRFAAVGEEGAIYLGQLPQAWKRVAY